MENSPKAFLRKVEEEVSEMLRNDSTGHDFYHGSRVGHLAGAIALEEGADEVICQVSGWTHDVCRPFEKETGLRHWGPEALERIEALLHRAGVEEGIIPNVLECVGEHEYYAFLGYAAPKSIESKVLQDADRLDALGAIGIARTFMFAGAHGTTLWVPGEKAGVWDPNVDRKSSAIAHFEEKLFKLADEMHTSTGRDLARGRQEFMKAFLAELFREWDQASVGRG